MRAAERAIVLLIEEIERLHMDFWSERSLSTAPELDDDRFRGEPYRNEVGKYYGSRTTALR